VGTLNLLEAARQFAPEVPFASMSTNKVYGGAPNELPLKELEARAGNMPTRLTRLRANLR
jgi:CDP-paratose 2-epimerase